MDTKRRRFWDNMNLNDLARNFFEGLLILVPVVATISVAWLIVQGIDGWLNIPIPGVGFVVTLALITLTGRYASTVFVQKVLDMMERVLIKAPFVKLLYTSIKDLIEAFMGEKRRFDQPVLVSLSPGGHAEAVGFVTRTDLEFLGLLNHVAVYFPQSYNFAGNLLVFPKEQVRPLDVESSEVMAFIVSGGVSGGRRARGRWWRNPITFYQNDGFSRVKHPGSISIPLFFSERIAAGTALPSQVLAKSYR